MNKVFKEFNHVCIRSWSSADVFGYADIVGDPSVMRYIGNGDIRDFDAATKEVERFQSEIDRQGWSRWAVSIGEDGPLIGYAGFMASTLACDFIATIGARPVPIYLVVSHSNSASRMRDWSESARSRM